NTTHSSAGSHRFLRGRVGPTPTTIVASAVEGTTSYKMSPSRKMSSEKTFEGLDRLNLQRQPCAERCHPHACPGDCLVVGPHPCPGVVGRRAAASHASTALCHQRSGRRGRERCDSRGGSRDAGDRGVGPGPHRGGAAALPRTDEGRQEAG